MTKSKGKMYRYKFTKLVYKDTMVIFLEKGKYMSIAVLPRAFYILVNLQISSKVFFINKKYSIMNAARKKRQF